MKGPNVIIYLVSILFSESKLNNCVQQSSLYIQDCEKHLGFFLESFIYYHHYLQSPFWG